MGSEARRRALRERDPRRKKAHNARLVARYARDNREAHSRT